MASLISSPFGRAARVPLDGDTSFWSTIAQVVPFFLIAVLILPGKISKDAPMLIQATVIATVIGALFVGVHLEITAFSVMGGALPDSLHRRSFATNEIAIMIVTIFSGPFILLMRIAFSIYHYCKAVYTVASRLFPARVTIAHLDDQLTAQVLRCLADLRSLEAAYAKWPAGTGPANKEERLDLFRRRMRKAVLVWLELADARLKLAALDIEPQLARLREALAEVQRDVGSFLQ